MCILPVMRTLFFAERFPPFPGGVAASALRIAVAIARTRTAVHVLALDPAGSAGEATSGDAGVLQVTRIGCAGPREATAGAALRHAAAIGADLVFGHFAGEAGFLAVFHARLAGVRSVVSIRGNDLDRGTLGHDDFARLLWTMEHADRIAAVTREHVRKAKALAGRDDVRWTPNVVDPERFRPVLPEPRVAAELGLAADDETVGFSGELRPRKGMHVLLDALSRLAITRPRTRLVLLGGVHPEARPAFAAAVRDRGLSDRIREVPYSDPATLPARLACCQVLAFPSLADGLPNALLEAMAAGRPCVASAVGGALDVIEDGQSGLLVPPGDAGALARACGSLLADPTRARMLGAAARLRIERSFGPAREAMDLRALLG